MCSDNVGYAGRQTCLSSLRRPWFSGQLPLVMTRCQVADYDGTLGRERTNGQESKHHQWKTGEGLALNYYGLKRC